MFPLLKTDRLLNDDNVIFVLICLSLFQPLRLLQVTDHRSVRSDPRLLILRLVASSTHHPASSQAVSTSHAHQGLWCLAATDNEICYITKLALCFAWVIPLQATWHPVYDLIVAGRYPDDRICPGDERTIDIYDSNTAELVCQLQDPTAAGIKSVSRFLKMYPKGSQTSYLLFLQV